MMTCKTLDWRITTGQLLKPPRVVCMSLTSLYRIMRPILKFTCRCTHQSQYQDCVPQVSSHNAVFTTYLSTGSTSLSPNHPAAASALGIWQPQPPSLPPLTVPAPISKLSSTSHSHPTVDTSRVTPSPDRH